MTPNLQNFISMLHNQLRNKLAFGKVPGYLPAARMPVLVSSYYVYPMDVLNLYEIQMFTYSNGVKN